MSFSRKRQVISSILPVCLLLLALFPAHGAASALTLAWDPNIEPDLAGYKVFYGNQPGIYDFVLDVGNVTQYTVTDLEPETQYYFALTAYDTSANESDFSAEVSAVTDPPHRVISGLGDTSNGWIEAFGEDYSNGEWFRIAWARYNSANGEARIATGDIDGDGRDEIIVGLGPVWERPYPSGYFQVLDDDYTPLTWGRVKWARYNNTNGETWPACGDVDGDGTDEIIIGLGRYPANGGWLEVFHYDGSSVTHTAWIRVNWNGYNKANGETRPACGDIDGDGRDEIVVGLGRDAGGWFEVFDDAATGYAHLAWPRIQWTSYNTANGESRPACGDGDGDGRDEVIIGLGSGGGGWLEVFHYDGNSATHMAWIKLNWNEYNEANGETRPACGDIDGDGKDEIVVGLSQSAGGWLEVFDDAATGYAHLAWPRVHWGSYNSANGETWPALKK